MSNVKVPTSKPEKGGAYINGETKEKPRSKPSSK